MKAKQTQKEMKAKEESNPRNPRATGNDASAEATLTRGGGYSRKITEPRETVFMHTCALTTRHGRFFAQEERTQKHVGTKGF